MRLHPDDPGDPHVFHAELPEFGTTHRIVFNPPSGSRTAGCLLMDLFSLRQRPEAYNPRRWASSLAMPGAVALTIRHRQNAPGHLTPGLDP